MEDRNYLNQVVEIKITRDLEFPYSGRAFITFPEGSDGWLVDDYDRVSHLPQKEIDEVVNVCRVFNKTPAMVEGKLIPLGREDYCACT